MSQGKGPGNAVVTVFFGQFFEQIDVLIFVADIVMNTSLMSLFHTVCLFYIV